MRIVILLLVASACKTTDAGSGSDAGSDASSSGLMDCAGSFRVMTMSELEPLRTCKTIGGNLEIRDNDGVASLAPLANLTAVSGHVEIRSLTHLTDVDGLS